MLQSLEVSVNDQVVGDLVLVDPDRAAYNFVYRQGTLPKDQISLTLPVGERGDSVAGVLPIFEMHLPTCGETSTLALLEVVGQHLLGRVRVGKFNGHQPAPLD